MLIKHAQAGCEMLVSMICVTPITNPHLRHSIRVKKHNEQRDCLATIAPDWKKMHTCANWTDFETRNYPERSDQQTLLSQYSFL